LIEHDRTDAFREFLGNTQLASARSMFRLQISKRAK
jgi:hypothetical protein